MWQTRSNWGGTIHDVVTPSTIRRLCCEIVSLMLRFSLNRWPLVGQRQQSALGPSERSGELTDLPPAISPRIVLQHTLHYHFLSVAPSPPSEGQQIPRRHWHHPVVVGADEKWSKAGPVVRLWIVPFDVAEGLVHSQQGVDVSVGGCKAVAEPGDGHGRSLFPRSSFQIPGYDFPAAFSVVTLVLTLVTFMVVSWQTSGHIDVVVKHGWSVAVKRAGHRRSSPPRCWRHVVKLNRSYRGLCVGVFSCVSTPDGVNDVLDHAAGELRPSLQHGLHLHPAVEARIVAPHLVGCFHGDRLFPILLSIFYLFATDHKEETSHRAHAVISQSQRETRAQRWKLPASRIKRQHLLFGPIRAGSSTNEQHTIGRRPERGLSALSDWLSWTQFMVLQRSCQLTSDQRCGHGFVGSTEIGEVWRGDQSEAQATQ